MAEPLSDQAPRRSLVYSTHMQILLSTCQISKFQNFHNFLNYHEPKGCFLSDRQKSPEFYALKNVKKKPIFFNSNIKKKKKSDSAYQYRRSQKGQKKSILILAFFYFAFLAPPARCGSNEYHACSSFIWK